MLLSFINSSKTRNNIFENAFNPLEDELNPIFKSQLAELFCGVFKFYASFSKKKPELSVYTQI